MLDNECTLIESMEYIADGRRGEMTNLGLSQYKKPWPMSGWWVGNTNVKLTRVSYTKANRQTDDKFGFGKTNVIDNLSVWRSKHCNISANLGP